MYLIYNICSIYDVANNDFFVGLKNASDIAILANEGQTSRQVGRYGTSFDCLEL